MNSKILLILAICIPCSFVYSSNKLINENSYKKDTITFYSNGNIKSAILKNDEYYYINAKKHKVNKNNRIYFLENGEYAGVNFDSNLKIKTNYITNGKMVFSYLQIEGYYNIEYQNALNKLIKQLYHIKINDEFSYSNKKLDKLISYSIEYDGLFDRWKKTYKEKAPNTDGMNGPRSGSGESCEINIISVSYNIVSVERVNKSFGGAYPLYSSDYLVYDLNNNERIDIKSMFTGNNNSKKYIFDYCYNNVLNVVKAKWRTDIDESMFINEYKYIFNGYATYNIKSNGLEVSFPKGSGPWHAGPFYVLIDFNDIAKHQTDNHIIKIYKNKWN